jgi:hypothetical protein
MEGAFNSSTRNPLIYGALEKSHCISETEINSLSLGEDMKDDDLQLEADRLIGVDDRMSE